MLKYKKKQVVEAVVMAKVCDVCGLEVKGYVQMQEFLHIDFIGGFGSIFGDGANVQADICQHCVRDKLGAYLRINN